MKWSSIYVCYKKPLSKNQLDSLLSCFYLLNLLEQDKKVPNKSKVTKQVIFVVEDLLADHLLLFQSNNNNKYKSLVWPFFIFIVPKLAELSKYPLGLICCRSESPILTGPPI